MNPLTIALMLAGGVGGFLGGKGKGAIDPQMLARLFGPNALAGDTQTLFNTLQGSPAFAAIMNSASESGSLAGQRARANIAKAGLGTSGVGAITNAVSRGFGQNMMLGARGNLWNTALQAARDNLSQRMGIFGQSSLAAQGQPTMAQSFGNALTGMAATGLTASLAPKTPQTPTATAAPTPTTSVVTAPMRRVQQFSDDPFHRQPQFN